MSRTANIIIATVMWTAIAAATVAAGIGAHKKRAAISVTTLRIIVADTTRVVTAEKITHWLTDAGIDPIGQNIDNASTRAIEQTIAPHPEVRRVSAWTDLEGRLTVRVEPRTPALRVRTAGGYRFWLSDDGVIMADRGDFAARVPVITGNVAWPFPPTARGNYEKMAAEVRRGYAERFSSLAAERRALEARAAENRAEINAVSSSRPGRLRSSSYKQIFAQRKATRTAELKTARDEIARSTAAIARQEKLLREKEKKSWESHRFLFKLANFVRVIEHDRFWSAQVVQINVVGGNGRGDLGGVGGRAGAGSGEWREPQVELIPRVGDHTIVLGELDGTESQRLENLRTFYHNALRHEGWNEYSRIDIKYRNQIVCTK